MRAPFSEGLREISVFVFDSGPMPGLIRRRRCVRQSIDVIDRRAIRSPGRPIDRAVLDQRTILIAIARERRDLVEIETFGSAEAACETEFDQCLIVSVPIGL